MSAAAFRGPTAKGDVLHLVPRGSSVALCGAIVIGETTTDTPIDQPLPDDCRRCRRAAQ